MADNFRNDLSFSTDIKAFETTEPNHADVFNRRGDQFTSNDAKLSGRIDDIDKKIQKGLPANGGNADTVDDCHAGVGAGDVLKLGIDAKVPESALLNSQKLWWRPSTTYAAGDTIQPLTMNKNIVFRAKGSGVSSATEPTWKEKDGETVQDGQVTWEVIDLRNAATVAGHMAGQEAGNVLVLDAGAKVPLGVLSFIQNNHFSESFLMNSIKKWWFPNTSYAVGQVIEPLGALNGQVYKCIKAGTSAGLEPTWPTDDFSEFDDGGVRWRTLLPESLSGAVGDIRFTMRIKPNEIKMNGALLLRASYPELWAFAQLAGMVDTEANWKSYRSGSFSSGDGSTTFRIPDIRGTVLRVQDEGRGYDDWTTRPPGGNQGDAMRNMGGSLDVAYADGIYQWAFTAGSVSGGGNQPIHRYQWQASYAVPTAAEFRMKNISYWAVIRYK